MDRFERLAVVATHWLSGPTYRFRRRCQALFGTMCLSKAPSSLTRPLVELHTACTYTFHYEEGLFVGTDLD